MFAVTGNATGNGNGMALNPPVFYLRAGNRVMGFENVPGNPPLPLPVDQEREVAEVPAFPQNG